MLIPKDPRVIFNEAAEAAVTKGLVVVQGDREQTYGSPTVNFENIARLWSVVAGAPITAHQVALMMVQLKVARLMNTPGHEDSWADIVGYVACGVGIQAVKEANE